MSDADLDKWISGETDIFFNPGKNGVLVRWGICLPSVDRHSSCCRVRS
jgi:hypothetical protein